MAGDDAEQVEQHDRSVGSHPDTTLSCRFMHTEPPITETMVEERRRMMLGILEHDGRLSGGCAGRGVRRVGRLIRRDFRDLDDRGFVQRVRGGAVRRLPAPTARERLQSVSAGQVAVARALAGRLQVRGGVIVLDNGSTSTLVAQQLSGRERLTVVTGNPAAASEAWKNGSRSSSSVESSTCPSAVWSTRRPSTHCGRPRRCRCARVCAIDDDGVTTDVAAEVAFKRAMVASAAEVWIPATDDKLGAGARTSWPTWTTSTCWQPTPAALPSPRSRYAMT